jgi:hypothetical protein
MRVTRSSSRSFAASPTSDRRHRDGMVERVELRGFEPLASSMRTRRATNCATAPCGTLRGYTEDCCLPESSCPDQIQVGNHIRMRHCS